MLARHISTLLNDDSLRHKMGQNNVAKINDDYSIDIIAKRMGKLYGEVLGVLGFGFGGIALLLAPFIENRAGRKAAVVLTAAGVMALLYIATMKLAAYLV